MRDQLTLILPEIVKCLTILLKKRRVLITWVFNCINSYKLPDHRTKCSGGGFMQF